MNSHVFTAVFCSLEEREREKLRVRSRADSGRTEKTRSVANLRRCTSQLEKGFSLEKRERDGREGGLNLNLFLICHVSLIIKTYANFYAFTNKI